MAAFDNKIPIPSEFTFEPKERIEHHNHDVLSDADSENINDCLDLLGEPELDEVRDEVRDDDREVRDDDESCEVREISTKPIERKPVSHNEAIQTATALTMLILKKNPDADPEQIRKLVAEKLAEHSAMFTTRVSAKAKAEAGVVANGIQICSAVVKSTGRKCSHKAKESSLYCGLHRNYKPENAGSSTGSTEKRICASFKKDGTPCSKTVKEGDFCAAHKANPILKRTVQKSDLPECSANTLKGSRCLKKAREGFHTCTLHASKEHEFSDVVA